VQLSEQLARQRSIATCHTPNANNRALLAACCSGRFDSGTPT
jgi:hypothetical protein